VLSQRFVEEDVFVSLHTIPHECLRDSIGKNLTFSLIAALFKVRRTFKACGSEHDRAQ